MQSQEIFLPQLTKRSWLKAKHAPSLHCTAQLTEHSRCVFEHRLLKEFPQFPPLSQTEPKVTGPIPGHKAVDRGYNAVIRSPQDRL